MDLTTISLMTPTAKTHLWRIFAEHKEISLFLTFKKCKNPSFLIKVVNLMIFTKFIKKAKNFTFCSNVILNKYLLSLFDIIKIEPLSRNEFSITFL